MPISYPINPQAKEMYEGGRGKVVNAFADLASPMYQGGLPDAQDDMSKLASLLGLSPEYREALMGGVMVPPMPAAIHPGNRTPEQLRLLRRLMQEEQRARGPVALGLPKPGYRYPSEEEWIHGFEGLSPADARGAQIQLTELGALDPTDLYARGQFYTGMRHPTREAVKAQGFADPLEGVFTTGFPASDHSGGPSISSAWGEASGVSTTARASLAKQFAADRSIIHRVMPLFGGPPRERSLNLMQNEGKNALQDVYDTVFNRMAQEQGGQLLSRVGNRINSEGTIGGLSGQGVTNRLNNILHSEAMGLAGGDFNRALSQELLGRGKRALIFNPNRHNEYEMLMLDPKHVLPIDYRPYQEYTQGVESRAKRSLDPYTYLPTRWREISPGGRKGLEGLKPEMEEGAGRENLRYLYQERPWTQRLDQESKDQLLQWLQPELREQVGSAIHGPTTPYEIQPVVPPNWVKGTPVDPGKIVVPKASTGEPILSWKTIEAESSKFGDSLSPSGSGALDSLLQDVSMLNHISPGEFASLMPYEQQAFMDQTAHLSPGMKDVLGISKLKMHPAFEDLVPKAEAPPSKWQTMKEKVDQVLDILKGKKQTKDEAVKNALSGGWKDGELQPPIDQELWGTLFPDEAVASKWLEGPHPSQGPEAMAAPALKKNDAEWDLLLAVPSKYHSVFGPYLDKLSEAELFALHKELKKSNVGTVNKLLKKLEPLYKSYGGK
jgi:hypothetical protein